MFLTKDKEQFGNMHLALVYVFDPIIAFISIIAFILGRMEYYINWQPQPKPQLHIALPLHVYIDSNSEIENTFIPKG